MSGIERKGRGRRSEGKEDLYTVSERRVRGEERRGEGEKRGRE